MGFKEMQAPQYPPRQWAIYGAAGSGKSHFASQMKTPALVIDSDARFTEQLPHAAGVIYQLSDEHTDNTNPDSIARQLRADLPGSGVRTIVVDSLTAILRPKINAAMSDIEHGRAKNGIAAFRGKAMTMALLQDSVTSSGADTLWIWHTHESMDAKSMKVTQKASIPDTELVRLRRSLNVILRLDVSDDGKRTVLVEWARNGKSGIRLTDTAGGWRGMPELLEQAIYSEGVKESSPSGMGRPPARFNSPVEAIAWGFEQGCFRDALHAKNAYEKCKAKNKPTTAPEMTRFWIADVERRKLEAEEEAFHEAVYRSGEPTEQPEQQLEPA